MHNHKQFGGSSAHRWLKCPMSAIDLLGVDEKESEAAAAGTEAHEIAAAVLQGEEVKVPDELKWAIDLYVETVQKLVTGTSELHVEESFTHPCESRIGGIADAIVWDFQSRHLTVIDFKYGFKRVEVPNNAQLMLYALLMVLTHNISPARITLTIVQPRADHPLGAVRSWDTDLVDLLEFWGECRRAIARVDDPAQRIEVVGDHCLYCQRAPLCKTLRESNQVVIDEAENISRGVAISPERLASMLVLVPRAQAMLKALWGMAESMLARGIQIPGFALDADNFGRRKWIDWPKVEEFLKAQGVDEERVYKKEPISPAQAEKLVPREALPELRSYATADRLPPKMVSTSDVRKPVAGIKASDVFKRVE